MSNIGEMLKAARAEWSEKEHTMETFYEERLRNLSKRLSRIRQLMNDPFLVQDHPEQMRRLVKAATYGYMDIQKTKPIE